MRILDRYILGTFLVSLAIVMAAMVGLAVLLDMVVNVNRILDLSDQTQKAGFWTLVASLAEYYFYKLFDYFQLLAAPSLLVAAAASFVRFNRSRELTGMKAAGVSLYRVMWPMIGVALVLDGFTIVNQELIIPAIAAELARDPNDMEVRQTFSVDFVRDANNNIIYAPIYDPKTQEMRAEPRQFPDTTRVIPARVRIFLRDAQYQPRGTIEAERATWDARQHVWRLTGGLLLPPLKEATLFDHVPTGPEGEPRDVYATNVGPVEVQRHRTSDFYRYMAYGELKNLAEDPMRGNRRQLQVAMHQHVTGPLLNLLLLLLGLPFVAGRDDRNYFISIGLAMALVLGVFVITFSSTAFGNAGHIKPLLAAWLPVFVVLPASVLAMESLRT